jgi:hypothetical protein
MNNNITTKKKAFLLLACIWFIITFTVIQTTYAKYVTNLDANTNISISYWNILVNDQDIIENSDISGSMVSVLTGNDYTKENVIVPGAIGYFDLNIDSSNVTVPFKLTVTSAINEASTLSEDFIVSAYSLDGGITINSLISDDTISDDDIINNDVTAFSIDVAEDTDTTLLRVYTTWDDDGIDSEEDTLLGISGGTAILDVTLDFEQITN